MMGEQPKWSKVIIGAKAETFSNTDTESTRGQCNKTFYRCNLRICIISLFLQTQPILMFVGKARSLP
jgi:hypothetical protein